MAVLAFSLLGSFAIGLILLGTILRTILRLWGSFLDSHEHNPAMIRFVMVAILVLLTLCEMSFSAFGWTHQWVVWVSLVVNIWGSFDACLRFPVAHDLESAFFWKQSVLLSVKSLSYAFGIVHYGQGMWKFLLVLLIIIWGLPVLYLIALPLDPADQVPADDRHDVDVAVKTWRLITCHQDRQRALSTCKTLLTRSLFSFSQCSPTARVVLCAASSSCTRAHSKGRLSV